MARYHIQLRTDTHVRMAKDVETDTYTSLRVEVAKFVGKMLHEHANEVWVDEDWRVDVTDDVGLILYIMELSARETAATMSRPKHDDG